MPTIDELEARLAEVEARLGPTPQAVPPIVIGSIADAPQPGSPIASNWANEITNRIVHRFATVAARDSAWPASTAGVGSVCITLDTGTMWQVFNAAWSPVPLTTDLAYVERTTPLTIGVGTEATANTVAQTAAIALDGRPFVVEFFAGFVTLPPGVGSVFSTYLFEDSVSLGVLTQTMSVVAGQGAVPVFGRRRLTSIGSHAYSARAACTGGSGQVNAGTGGPSQQVPAYIRVGR